MSHFPAAYPRLELEAALWWRLAEAYRNQDDIKALKWYEKALTRLSQSTELKEGTADAAFDVAYKLYDEKKFTECIDLLNRTFELKPDYAWAYFIRGAAYHDLKQYQRAIDDYSRAIDLDPSYTSAYYNRGLAYHDLKEYQRAIDDYSRAIDLDPTKVDVIVYNIRGLSYLWLGNQKQAIDDYRRCQDFDSTDINIIWMIEWIEMGKKRIGTEITTRLEKIAAKNPEHYVALVCSGVASGLHNKLKEGLAELERAISLEAEEWDAYFWKGMVCAYLGRNSMAIEAINTALALDLPPLLLTPLYWLENDRPNFFSEYAAPLLIRYRV